MSSQASAGVKRLEWIIKDYLTHHQLDRFKGLLANRVAISHSERRLNLGESFLFFNPLLRQLSHDGYLDYQSPSKLFNNDSFTWRRRVWAQGELQLLAHMTMDREYACQEKIKFAKKIGNDYFICMERCMSSVKDNPCLREFRTLVYTNSPVGDIIRNDHLEGEVIGQFKFTEMDIISYTLMSLNPHKVHWNKDYCRNVEGYKDIIVQGPLAVQVLMAFAHSHFQKKGSRISRVKYKNINFIYPEINMDVCTNGHSIWMRDQKMQNKIYVWAEMQI